MSGRHKAARVLVILGCVVLFASFALHSFAGFSQVFPALDASNLNPRLQAAFRVIFLALGWHWLLTAIVALVAGFTETKLRKTLVLVCGLALLLEAGVGASMMGFFIGNEMIGSAALLLVSAGLLFDRSGARN